MATSENTNLTAGDTIAAINRLKQRIKERFPDRNLSKVCAALEDLAENSRERLDWINRPNWFLRIAIGIIIIALLLALVISISVADLSVGKMSLTDMITTLEAGMNDVVLIGAALFFLITIETRVKRKRALDALNEIRSIAHVIDMHQLTKDPSVLKNSRPTESSPERTLDSYQLCRYLDYCSEMFSLTGKVAALYAQHLPDSVVLGTVNEIEELTTGFSRKVWQKISLLNMLDFND